MNPRPVDREEKKREILMAAHRIFSGKGYYGSTIQDVAREAGIGKGTIYEYFPSKEALFYGILDLFMGEFEGMMQQNLPGEGNPVEAIVSMVNDALENMEATQDYFPLFLEIFAMVQRGEGQDLFQRMGQWMERYAELFVPFIKEGQKQGVIQSNIHPFVMARTLIASLDGVFLHYLLFPGDARFRTRQKREFERIVRGALQYSEPTNP